jgi:hypothetical protein
MSRSPKKFAQLLSRAVRQIAFRSNIQIQIIQDELGYALGREAGGSSIEYWRKGHIPSRLAEVEALARELVQRGGLTTPTELEQFLTYAGHPDPTGRARKILPDEPSPVRPSSSPSNELVTRQAPPMEEHPPFFAGPPITHPRYFFGRERELKRLFNLLSRRPLQNAAIIGPRRSGKTSLLHYLKTITTIPPSQLRPRQRVDWLPAPEQYRWILVDFQDSRLGSRKRLLHYLLSCLNFPIPEPCNLDRFLDVVGRELDTPTVVLLDEIGVALQRYPELDDSFWEGLRALATNQVGGNLAFVLAAQEPPDRLAHFSNLGSPFFNIFGYTAILGPLKKNEARALIDSSPLPFSNADVEWILEQSGCWPILLQILCRERLISLEDDEPGLIWREDGLQQIAPFRHLLGHRF